MRYGRLSIIACGLLIVAANSAMAQAPHGDFHTEMDQNMQKMNNAMATMPITGNVDIDFAGMMIPHHQGAVDMAKLELQYGKDPAMRKLAQKILDNQPKEIIEMQKSAERIKSANAQAAVTSVTKTTTSALTASNKKNRDKASPKTASMADVSTTASATAKKHKPAVQR